jgi:hypothetical protein
MHSTNVYREIGYLLLMQTKQDVIQGAGLLSLTYGQANSTGMQPDQKVNQAE